MLVFPSNPNAGDVFAPGPGFPTWMWDGDKWTRASSAPFTLGALSDVAVTEPTQGQTLTWDGAEEKWINSALPLGDLADVVISVPIADKSVLTWNGAAAVWDAQLPPVPDLSTLAGTVTVLGQSGQPSLIARLVGGANNPGLFVTSTEATGKTTLSFSGSANFNGSLAIGGRDVMNFAGDGSIIIPAANNTTLTVMGGPAWTALAVQGAPTALFVAGEATFTSAAQTDYWLKLYAAGGGFIASNAGNFSWNNAGQFGINGAIPESPWHVGLTVTSVSDWRAWAVNCVAAQPRGNCLNLVSSGNAADYALNVNVPNLVGATFNVSGRGTVNCGNALNVIGTDEASYACVITASPSGTSGRGYGLAVRSSTNGTPFIIWNAAWSQQLFQVNTDGNSYSYGWNTFSSARYKADVRAVTREHARATLAGLRAVSFRWKEREREGTHYGLIAEEVARIDANLVTYDDDGRPQGVRYDEALLMLLPLMQELLEKEESHGKS